MDPSVAVQEEEHPTEIHQGGDRPPGEHVDELQIRKPEQPRAEEEPQASERRQRNERAMERLPEPASNLVVPPVIDEGEEDARDQGVEARVRAKVDRAVETDVGPRRVPIEKK